MWAFCSISWAVGTFLFVWLFDPYYTDGWLDMVGDEALRAFGVMIIPPLFLGAMWFGYKRFVKCPLVDGFGRPSVSARIIVTLPRGSSRQTQSLVPAMG